MYDGPVLINSEPAIISAAISIEYDSLLLLVLMSNPRCLMSVLSIPILIGSFWSLFIRVIAVSGRSIVFCMTVFVFCANCFTISIGAFCFRSICAIFGLEYAV